MSNQGQGPGQHLPGAEAAREAGHVTFQRGQLVANRYTVLDMIGRGGMGCIYKVFDNTLKEEVALKTLLPQFARDKLVVERFYNEARIARQLSHPNIIRVHDIGLAGHVLYISMEYIEGRSLRSILDSLPPGQRLPIRTTLRVLDELCAALEYAHQFTIHRDIKPENVMVSRDGHVRLMDFGISKLMAPQKLTKTSVIMGTPHYMSPEQLKDSGRVDARADIYSLGVMLYEIMSGHLPTGVMKPISQIMREVPPSMDTIIARCTEPDPADRFGTVKELREALRPIREVVEAGSSAPSLVPPRQRGRSGNTGRHVVGTLLSLFIVLATAGGLYGAERYRSQVLENAPAAGGAGAEALYRNLAERIERAQTLANGQGGEALNGAVATGQALWTEAQAQADAGDFDTAQRTAWRALDCFLAPLIAPEGMVFIPPGEVTLDTSRTVEVAIDGFFMDAKEVTLGDYLRFVRQEGWQAPRYTGSVPPADYPVSAITFYDANAYAASQGKRLPTEAQWARAAYGPAGRPVATPWPPDTARPAYAGPGFGDLKAPGSYPDDRTAFGCFDMLGSMQEWTRTPFAQTPGDPDDDDAIGPEAFGDAITVRGGHYGKADPLTARYGQPFEEPAYWIGFRCVRELPRSLDAVDEIVNSR